MRPGAAQQPCGRIHPAAKRFPYNTKANFETNCMSVTLSNARIAGEQPAPLPSQADSEIVPGPEVSASPSDPGMLRKLYAALLRCCIVEERAEGLALTHKRKPPFTMARGLEATTVGSLIELTAGDAVASEMGYAPRLFAGQPLGLYFAELYGVRAEYLAFAPQAAETAIHLLPGAPSVAAQLSAAAGYALALKQAKRRNVVVVHLPDGGNALGYWHEAASLARAERLPLVFVAITDSLPSASLGSSDARQRAASYGIPGITVDGGDLVAMWRVAQESIHRARSGAGPTLIDSQVPAVPRHAKPQPGDGGPLARMQHYLEKRSLWKEAWKEELRQKFATEIAEAATFFRKAGETQ